MDWRRARGVSGRLMLAHLVAYPLAFAWAVACIPPAIALVPERILLEQPADAVVAIVLRSLLWPCVAVALVAHGVAIPWSFARPGADARARRVYLVTLAVLGAVALLGGGGAWLWLILR